MDIPILFEDDEFLVINKPYGVVVNRAETVQEETIQDWAEKKMRGMRLKTEDTTSDFYKRAGIVHRIDKETSGVLLLAKTESSFLDLQRQFKERSIQKTYRALVHGDVVPPEGEIQAPIGRLPWNRERFGIVPGGKEAITRYKKIRTYTRKDKSGKEEIVSLMEVYPKTGRTHQIRVHFKYINHPLVGDYLYAGRKTSRNDRRSGGIASSFGGKKSSLADMKQENGRVLLHARSIVFHHPKTGKPLAIEAPIPDDMNMNESA